MTDGKVTLEITENVSLLNIDEQIVTLLVDEQIVTLNIGTAGPQGIRGNSVLSGSGEPNLYLGINGDFYLNNDTKELYGPKTNSGWGSPVSLIPETNLGYVHIQSVPSSTWTITHDLGFMPNITVVDSGDNVVEGSYNYQSETTVVLTFDGAFSGKAYLS